VAERTSRLGIGAAVLVPSYRHPVAQASAIATLEALAPGRLWAGFGTGFTGRFALGQPALTLAHMRQHMQQVRGLLRGEAVEIDGGMAQLLAAEGWLPDRAHHGSAVAGLTGPQGPPVGA
jgi:5,10-methylenetetrahydromethanopterin reductase